MPNCTDPLVVEANDFRLLRYARYFRIMSKLLSHFRVVHVHANNLCAPVLFGKYRFGPLLEVTLVRKDLSRAIDCVSAKYRPGLDFSNDLARTSDAYDMMFSPVLPNDDDDKHYKKH